MKRLHVTEGELEYLAGTKSLLEMESPSIEIKEKKKEITEEKQNWTTKIESLYENHSFTITEAESRGETSEWIEECEKNGTSICFGEVLVDAFQTLMKATNLIEKKSFLDIGSGRGNLVLTAFLCTPNLTLVKGVELVKPRFEMSRSALQTLQAKYPKKWDLDLNEKKLICSAKGKTTDSPRKLVIVNDCCWNINPKKFSVIFCNISIREETKFIAWIEKCQPHTIILTYRELTSRSIGLGKLREHISVQLRTSWSEFPFKFKMYEKL